MADEHDRVAMVSDIHALKVDGQSMIAKEARESRQYVDVNVERLTETLKQFPTRAEVKEMIADEAAKTRRYFDIMVERMTDVMKPLADGVAHHSTVLDDHESRIQQLEK